MADILREIRRRVTERVLFEHTRAKHAAEYERCAGAMAAFQRYWVSTGVATLGRHGPRLNLMRAPPASVPPPLPGAVHVRIVGTRVQATRKHTWGSRNGPPEDFRDERG